MPSNSQLESCVYIPCLQRHLKASCSLQLESEQTNAAIPTHSIKKKHQVSNSDQPYPPGFSGRHPEYSWPISPAPVVSSQISLDGKPPRNKRDSPGRSTACRCAPARISGEISALVFKTPGIFFKKIQLLFTLRWPLPLHDIMLVSCRINLPANPSFTQDIYLSLIHI